MIFQNSLCRSFCPALAALVVALFVGCASPPDYPDEPVIAFKSMSRNWMLQNSNPNFDSLALTLTFTDGNGDLGTQTDSFDIFVNDGRDNFPKFKYKIPYIDELGSGNGISGEISIVLNTTCCVFSNGVLPCSVVPGVPTDTLTYLVYIRDRAGLLSNVVETPPIVLYCQ